MKGMNESFLLDASFCSFSFCSAETLVYLVLCPKLQRIADRAINHAMSLCAGHHHEPDHDPTLASCCQRDLAQQAQDIRCLQRLQATDRSTVRTDMTAAVLAAPNYSDPQSPAQEFSDLSSEDEAGE